MPSGFFLKKTQGLFHNFDQKMPTGFCLKKPTGFFHSLIKICPQQTLSHSSRVLSQIIQNKLSNIPTGFFLINSKKTLSLVQFHHKLSINSVGMWLSLLWSYLWVICERTLDEWLRVCCGHIFIKL